MIPSRRMIPLLFSVFCIPLTAYTQETNECYLCAQSAAVVSSHNLRESETPVREREGWAPPKKIVTMFGPDMMGFMKPLTGDIEFVAAGSQEAVADVIGDADIYIGTCTREIVERGINLKWIHIHRAGVDSCAGHSELIERGVLITNSQRLFSIPIAEHALALTFSLSRKLYLYRDMQTAGEWNRDILSDQQRMMDNNWEINGKTMLVVGLGGIGTEVARRANALGMRVLATRNSSREGPSFVEYVGLAHELNELAAQADVVVSALPLTDQTRSTHDAAFFAAMKPTAIFVNVGRGETVNTDDLVAALDSGSIAGAGLDVASPEPLPDDHPLWRHPDVIMSPHMAGASDRTIQRIAMTALENMRRYIAGDRMFSVVDLRRGY